MAIQFTKLHGAGNDFLIIDGRSVELDWSRLAMQLCDRHFGVGADGLLIMGVSTIAPVSMREFNPDGTEAEMSGNGIRCLAKYVLEHRVVPPETRTLAVETGAGLLTVEPYWRNGNVTRATVSMGRPILRCADIPVNIQKAGSTNDRLLDRALAEQLDITSAELLFDAELMVEGQIIAVTAVSMGNPHVICFYDEPTGNFPLSYLGPIIEHHPAFPNRTNCHVVNVLARDRIVVRTWERGVGETLACGTGISAAVVAARLHGYVDADVTVEAPGGEFTVFWPGHGSVLLSGPVVELFSGEWSNEFPC